MLTYDRFGTETERKYAASIRRWLSRDAAGRAATLPSYREDFLTQEAAARLPGVFARKGSVDATEAKEREKELFEEIGRLKMELEWLKKKAGELER